MPKSGLFLLSLLLLLLSGVDSRLRAQLAGTYEHYTVEDADHFPVSEYVERRARVLQEMLPGEGMILLSGELKMRSNDVEYHFRQQSDIIYLTGIHETDCALLLLKDGVEDGDTTLHEILFVAERDPMHEQWVGIRMGPEVASRLTGVARTTGISDLSRTAGPLLRSLSTLYYDGPERARFTEPISGAVINPASLVNDSIRTWLRDTLPVLKPASEIVHKLRLIKSPAEIAMIQAAVDLSIEGHRRAMRRAFEGVTEYQLEAEMEYAFLHGGAEGPGYTSIIGSGPNSCILHYNTNRRKTEPGDLVLMDCGAEYRGYAADITRTFPVSGEFTEEQRLIYELVLRAQQEAIGECLDGREFWDPHRRAVQIMTDGLIELGIITEPEEARPYLPHGTSHYLGLDVHDVGRARILRTGMVLTVEPGIYIPAGSPCNEKWWNIGVRIEDDILIDGKTPVNLSKDLERTVEQIEQMIGADHD